MNTYERKIGRLSIASRSGRRIAFTACVDRDLTGAAIEAVVVSLIGRDTIVTATTTFLGHSPPQSSVLVELSVADVEKLGIGTFGWRMSVTPPGGATQDLLIGTLEIKP